MFKKAGIEVELHEYNNGGDLMSAMASGELDAGYVGITPAIYSELIIFPAFCLGNIL